MIAKVIHNNLNAGGGAERLALVTIDLLNEMGFEVDLETSERVQYRALQKHFGYSNLHLRTIKQLDLRSFLLYKEKRIISSNASLEYNIHTHNKTCHHKQNDDDDSQYDLIVNTHGDMLPYILKSHSENPLVKGKKKPILITYCHYPLLPYLVKNGRYKDYIRKYLPEKDSEDDSTLERLMSNAYLLYKMALPKSNILLTNSEFSKRAIKQLFSNISEPIVVSPPVDIETFRTLLTIPKRSQDIILVISRFDPDKQVKNAIEIAKILNDRNIADKMIIVGNTSKSAPDYLYFLRKMIQNYFLQDYVRLEVGINFERLLHLMSKSKIYLHAMIGEPFGISVVEAMSAGLIPVVPDVGGSSEFVPKQYHYSTLKQAAEIIRKILTGTDWIGRKNDGYIKSERIKISNSVARFSVQSYKDNLRKIINSQFSNYYK
ncbi:MAG: glycosyltransferase [Thermoproteota archaeon]|nr:glycosyltransferase [Thermoproteota archaeon]